jgi:hypothetical protein
MLNINKGKTMSILRSDRGKIVISIVIGFGFATMFRRACRKNSCYIIKGPKKEELQKYYRIDQKCYQYNPYSINCPANSD